MENIESLKNRINQIESEVKGLHPLLNSLLPKLPQVEDVEYTHGQNEMGADFVLEKADPTLGGTYYIGVVAKKGKIQQNLSEIERQIDECCLERYFKGGKKKIRLSEIWVIATENISNQAQIKIHDKFSSTKIQFVSGLKIAQLVDKYIPHFWLNVPDELGGYLNDLWNRNRDRDRQMSLLPGNESSFYIDLDIYHVDDAAYEKNTKPNLVDIEKEILRNKVSFIQADMGSGKSKILRRIIDKYSTASSFSKLKIIPILMPYIVFIKQYEGDIDLCIKGSLGKAMKDVSENNVEFLLLIDGMDEVINKEKDRAEEFASIIEAIKLKNNVRVVFTSRPLKILEEELLVHKSIRKYAIRPLSINKIINFISKICTSFNLSTRLVEDLKKSNLFKQLPRSPIAAILLSKLLSENEKELPSNLTELYSQSVELMLGRWDMDDKNLSTQREYITADRICQDISEFILENNLICISIGDAEGFFRKYLEERNLDIDKEELFEKVVERSGILVADRTNNTISFKHRSFAEYLYAKKQVANNNEIVNEKIFDPYWVNTNFFYLGITKDCPQILEEILAYSVLNESDRWLKIINMPQYLLAANHSPYKIVKENLFKLVLEASSLYFDIKRGNTKTKLNEMPEMQVLWLIQYLLKDAYGYEYFKDAIEDAGVQIFLTSIDDVQKAYALFFLGTIGGEIGEVEPYKYLLEHIKTENLPIPVSMALECESHFNKNIKNSPLMKKHKKKLHKLFKTKNIRDAANQLFKKPMRITNQKK